MIQNLPKWYRMSSIDTVHEETLEKRSAAIKNIFANKELQWILDCIRLYLGKPVKSKTFLKEMFTEFNTEDLMFLEDDASIENKVLAGAIIAYCIENGHDRNEEIATALKAGSFGTDLSEVLNSEIIELATNFLNESAVEFRTPDDDTTTSQKLPALKEEGASLETIVTYIKSLISVVKANEKKSDAQISSLKHKIRVLEEESDIHWWLFRAYNSQFDKPVAELLGPQGPLSIGFELSELVSFTPPMPNFKEFIKLQISKISDVESTEYSIQECVDHIFKDWQNILEDYKYETYGNLTPILAGYHFAIESDGNDSWLQVFEKKTGVKGITKYSSVNIAEQFCTELLLIAI